MNMKKLMAVVLAVVLAISAMAVNVFAAEGEVVKIPLRPTTALDTVNSRSFQYTFEFPIYGMFGYLDQNSYLEFNLPKWFGDGVEDVVYTISTNLGNKVDMTQRYGGKFYGTTAEEYEKVYVSFGAFDRPWFADNANGWAVLRQASFGEISTITVTAEVTIKDHPQTWDNTWSAGDFSWGAPNSKMYVQLWTAGDDGVKNFGDETADNKVTTSILYAKNMKVNKADASNAYNYKSFDFVSDIEGLSAVGGENGWDAAAMKKVLTEATTDANGSAKTELKNVDLVWDMTLLHRSYIINAESARVVIKLADDGEHKDWGNGGRGATGKTNGIAAYSLYLADTPMSSNTIGQWWWQSGSAYNRVAKRVAFTTIDTTMGDVKELSFEVPVDKLYNSTYGLSAGVTSTFRIYAEAETPVSTFNSTGWDAWARNYNHWTNDAYIELTMPATDDSSDLVVDDPIEHGDDEPIDNGEDNVDVTEPTEPTEPAEDNNPPTGIVLAVLPMVVAAAAVVASKRR